MKHRNSCLLACFVWIYAVSISLPPLFGWGSYGPQAGNISCSVSWGSHDPITHTRSYISYIFSIGFIIPLIVIVSSYCSIIITLRNSRERVGSGRKHEEKVTKMVALMISAFLVAWTPYAVVALGAQFFNVCIDTKLN
ncbi:green-sensitive opsin-like [Belonocnema kinseyi]|uniref:green-sensitive opsin-like n=1 Tax=Belonocnema kinseyi TaxID=2817044 RepID=UPI00143CE215|nr:green-sensitive opsin-like [Belonocnema kinseyi]